MHPQVPSVRQHLGFGLHDAQLLSFGQLRGLVPPELEPAPASVPELAPELPLEPPELAPAPPHTPATHVTPTVVQSWHEPADLPQAMSTSPVWHVPEVSQQPLHVPPWPQLPAPGPPPPPEPELLHATKIPSARHQLQPFRMASLLPASVRALPRRYPRTTVEAKTLRWPLLRGGKDGRR
jgi:hypothetical protein